MGSHYMDPNKSRKKKYISMSILAPRLVSLKTRDEYLVKYELDNLVGRLHTTFCPIKAVIVGSFHKTLVQLRQPLICIKCQGVHCFASSKTSVKKSAIFLLAQSIFGGKITS